MSKRLIILGAGPGGYVAAIRAAQLGFDTTIIEKGDLGGTCLNRGCIPTKAIISSLGILNKIKHASEHGISISGEISFDVAAMIARKDNVVANLRKGIGALLKSFGVKLVNGFGRITGTYEVEVTAADGSKSMHQADGIIIATGSTPLKFSLFPFDGARVITSDEAVNMTDVPESILIIGAGVIGCEFGFIYNSMGSKVTLVEMMPRCLATEDSEMSEQIQREMRKNKIELLVNTKVEKVTAEQDKILVRFDSGKEMRVDRVLVSIGRAFETNGIGLETIGVKTNDKGKVLVNEKLETNIPGVYAIGDAIGGLMLAHVASAEGKTAVSNFAGENQNMDYSVVPSGIFTEPEIGSVGMTSDYAKQNNIPFETGIFSFKGLGKAHAMGEATGMVKIIGDPETKKVLGVHIIGPHATDLVHEAALAMQAHITVEEIAETIHAHPTLSEGVAEAAEDLLGMAIHSPKKKK